MSMDKSPDKLFSKTIPKLSLLTAENVNDLAKLNSRKNSLISDQSLVNNTLSNMNNGTSSNNIRYLDIAIAIFDFSDNNNTTNKSDNNQKNEETTNNTKKLYFKKTDIIYVFDRNPNGWWDGLRINEVTNKVERGWFPSTFIKILKENVNCSIYSKNSALLNNISSRRPSIALLTEQLSNSRRNSNVGLTITNKNSSNNTSTNNSYSNINSNNNSSNESNTSSNKKENKLETYIALPVPIVSNSNTSNILNSNTKSRRNSLHHMYLRRNSSYSINSKSSPVRRSSLLNTSQRNSISYPNINGNNEKSNNVINKNSNNSIIKDIIDPTQVDPLEKHCNSSSINVVSKHSSISTATPDNKDDTKLTKEKINILSLEEVEMTINSFHSPLVSTWSPIAITDEKTKKLSSKILYYNKELNIYCSEFPLISVNDSKKVFNGNRHSSDQKKRASLTSSVDDDNTYKKFNEKKSMRAGYPINDHFVDLRARTLSESFFEISNLATTTHEDKEFGVSSKFESDNTMENNFGPNEGINDNVANEQKVNILVNKMSAKLNQYRNVFKSNVDDDVSSKNKYLTQLNDDSVFVKQAIFCDENLFYFHSRDIRTWAELENLTFHYAKLTHKMFLRNDNLNYTRYFSMLANMVIYIQLACRLLQRQLKLKRLDKKIRTLLKKLISSLSRISINSLLYFNLTTDANGGLLGNEFAMIENFGTNNQDIQSPNNIDAHDDTYSTISERTIRRSTVASKIRSPNIDDNLSVSYKNNDDISNKFSNSNIPQLRNVSVAESKETIKNRPGKRNHLRLIFENVDLEFIKFMKNVHTLQLTLSNGVLENGEFGKLPEILPRFFKGTFSGGSWTNPFSKFIYPVDAGSSSTNSSVVAPSLAQRSGKLSTTDSVLSNNTVPPRIFNAIALASGAYVAKDAPNDGIIPLQSPLRVSHSISSAITGSRQGYSKTYSRARTAKRKKVYPLNTDTLDEMNKIANGIIENFNVKATEAFLENEPKRTERNFELNSKTYEQINENTSVINILENLDLTIFINLKRLIRITPESIDKESEEFLRHAMQSISIVISEFYEIKQEFHDVLIRLIISAQHTTLNDPYVFTSMKPMTQTGFNEPRLLGKLKSADSKEIIKLEKRSRKLFNRLVQQDVEFNNMSFLNSSNDFILSCEKYVEVARMACNIVEQLIEERENLLNYAARTMRNNLTTELLKGEQDIWYSYESESDSDLENDEVTKIGRKQNHNYDAPWFLQTEYDFDLVYDSKGQIKGGTKEALIEHLTCHEIIDPSFNLVMLISFKSIMSTREFLYSLMYRYNLYPPEGLTFDEYNTWVNEKLIPIKCRVINIMKLFFQQYWTPKYFEQGLGSIEEFIRLAVTEEIPGADQLLSRVKEVINQANHVNDSDAKFRKNEKIKEANNNNKLEFNRMDSKVSIDKLLNIDPYDYAVQLTILEHGLYLRINIFECLGRAWGNKYGNISDSKNISKFIHHANALTNFVSYSIVQELDVHKRSRNIEFFIDVAYKCKELNNYSSMTAIVSALYSSPVYRLKKTWRQVIMESTHKLNELNNLMDSKKNFLNYRNQLRLLKDVSCVPFFGIYLSDLTFTNAGNPDYLLNNHELINFSKRVKIVDIIEEILNFKRIPYRLKKNDKIQKIIEESLRDVPHIEIQYQLSLEMEPRVTTTTNNNLLQERN